MIFYLRIIDKKKEFSEIRYHDIQVILKFACLPVNDIHNCICK